MLKPFHCSPLNSNASINRRYAAECFAAGMPAEVIAKHWPKVFTVNDGKLSQTYDSEFYEDGKATGIYETRYTILRSSVDRAIAAHVRRMAGK